MLLPSIRKVFAGSVVSKSLNLVHGQISDDRVLFSPFLYLTTMQSCYVVSADDPPLLAGFLPASPIEVIYNEFLNSLSG